MTQLSDLSARRYYITPAMIASGRYPQITYAVLHGAWEPG